MTLYLRKDRKCPSEASQLVIFLWSDVGVLSEIRWKFLTPDVDGCVSYYTQWTEEASRCYRCVHMCFLCVLMLLGSAREISSLPSVPQRWNHA